MTLCVDSSQSNKLRTTDVIISKLGNVKTYFKQMAWDQSIKNGKVHLLIFFNPLSWSLWSKDAFPWNEELISPAAKAHVLYQYIPHNKIIVVSGEIPLKRICSKTHYSGSKHDFLPFTPYSFLHWRLSSIIFKASSTTYSLHVRYPSTRLSSFSSLSTSLVSYFSAEPGTAGQKLHHMTGQWH